MKIQFDANQQFQLDAVSAIVDLFEGQPQGFPEFSVIDLGSTSGLFVGQDTTELGVGNRLLLSADLLTAHSTESAHSVHAETATPFRWFSPPLGGRASGRREASAHPLVSHLLPVCVWVVWHALSGHRRVFRRSL
jgi:hypothetical protein